MCGTIAQLLLISVEEHRHVLLVFHNILSHFLSNNESVEVNEDKPKIIGIDVHCIYMVCISYATRLLTFNAVLN